MDKLITGLLSLFLCSILFVIPSLAYEDFSINSYFDNDYDGVILFNSDYNQTLSWNSTCYNATGCLFITNNGTSALSTLYATDNIVFNKITDNATFLDALADSETLTVSLDKNKELLVSVSYLFNESITTPAPQLQIRQRGNLTYANYIILNATPNIWHNITLNSDVSSIDREMLIDIIYVTDNQPTILAIDKFKVFTLDIIEFRQDWVDSDTEFTRYCGSGYNAYCGYHTSVNNSAVLFGLTEDNIPCMAVKLGNTTIATRIISNDSYDSANNCPTSTSTIPLSCRNGLFQTRYGFLIHTEHSGASCDYLGLAFMESLSLTTVKITDIRASNYDWYNQQVNDGGAEIYSNGNLLALLGRTIQDNATINGYHNYTRELLDLNKSVATPSGTQWKFRNVDGSQNSANSSWYNFFSTTWYLTDYGLICDESINYQYFILADGTEAPSSRFYCGAWGCERNLVYGYGCNFGFIGSQCIDNYSYTTIDINGTVTYGNCFPNYCYDLTNNTIGCFATYEDYLAHNATISDFFDNPAENVAFNFAGLFGITDTAIAKDLFAIVCSLIISIISLIVVATVTRGKIHFNSALAFIGTFTLVFLVMFGVAGFLSLGTGLIVGALTLIMIFYMVLKGA